MQNEEYFDYHKYRTELERAFVGGMLSFSRRDPDLFEDIMTEYPFECWVDHNCREAVKILSFMAQNGINLDIYELGKRLIHEIPGSSVWLVECLEKSNCFIGPTDMRHKILGMRLEYLKEEVHKKLEAAASDVFTAEDSEVVCEMIKDVSDFAESITFNASFEENQIETFFDGITQEPEQLITSPWRGLNEILAGGLARGELVIVGARPSVGKSAFASNWFWHTAKTGGNVLLFSLEMSKQEVFYRIVSQINNIDSRIFRQSIDKETYDKIMSTRDVMKDKMMYVDDRGKITFNEIRKVAKGRDKIHKLDLILIDYLQLVTPDGRVDNREQEVAEMSRKAKILAKDLNVPVVVLSQLNRLLERENRQPKMSDLRESGSLEQDADIILFLHNNKKICDICAEKNMPEPLDIILAKGRNTGTGFAGLVYDKRCQLMTDMDEEYCNFVKSFSDAREESLL